MAPAPTAAATIVPGAAAAAAAATAAAHAAAPAATQKSGRLKKKMEKVKGSQNVLTSFSLGVTVEPGTWRQQQEGSIVLPVVFYN